MSDNARLVVLVPKQLREAMKASQLPKSEIVRRALQQFFGTEYVPVKRGRPRKSIPAA